MLSGKRLKISLFGESHSPCLGAVIEGLPCGLQIDEARVESFLNARRGGGPLATPRYESDIPRVISGITAGVTDGSTLRVEFDNNGARPQDYAALRAVPRPGHADWPFYAKYGDIPPGGGRSSGRMTLPMCYAGALCLQYLESAGIAVGAHIIAVGKACDAPFDAVNISPERLAALAYTPLPVCSEAAADQMRCAISDARDEADSVGGVIECAATGLPPGLGGPLDDSLKSRLAGMLFCIPGVCGLEFGAGFTAAATRGTENNDAYYFGNGSVRTRTNNHGGLLGGMTTGMPLLLRIAFKPTPSVAAEQESVDLEMKTGFRLSVEGRHDPCIVTRAAPAAVSAVAAVLLDAMMEEGRIKDG